MRIVHTADWHLGKIVNNFQMLEDQTYYFEQLLYKLKELQPDILVMAGDLYDRSNPPKEAVTLSNEIFTRLVNDLNIKVLAISGNHDSPERVEYGSGLLEKSGLFIEGVAKSETKEVVIDGIHFWLAAFEDPVSARKTNADPDIKTYEDAAIAMVNRIVERMDPSQTNILIYHGFLISGDVGSIEESDSERPLQIGTTEYVPTEHFDAFDYVMLGHLHKGQKVGRDTIRYSGSPLKYSKSETKHRKGFDLIDIEGGEFSREKIEITPLHDMAIKRGTFAELMESKSDDYIFVELTDGSTVLDAMNRLRKQYPNIMELQYVNLDSVKKDAEVQHTSQTVKNRSTIDLFDDFYSQYSEQGLSEKERDFVVDAIKEVQKEGNE